MKNLFFVLAMAFVGTINAQDDFELKANGLFGDLSARQIGPAVMSGRIIDLETHPTDDKTLLVGTAGGGVWKTTDGGTSYNSIFDKHTQSIGSVEIDPNDPNQTYWVGTGEIWTRNSVSVGDGLYKTTDGGKNWTKVGLEKSERISSIIVNPNNSQEVIVGVLGALWGDSEERGIYKTTDGGETWDKLFYIDAKTGCSDVIMDPNNTNTLYASFWEFRRTAYSFNSGGPQSALYKSTDGGKNWNKIHNGFPKGDLGRIAMAVAPSNSKVLYSVIESSDKSANGLYRSDDAGASWTHLNKDFELTVRPFYFSRIVVDPKDENKLCKAGVFGSISKDGGKTFTTVGSGVHADIHDYAYNVNNSDIMYLGCDGGVYRSLDAGTKWEMAKGLPLSQFYHVTTDNETPFNVYGGLQDNGSWVGPSTKRGGVKASDWISVGAGDGFRVYPNPGNSNIVYSEMQGAENIWRVDIEKDQLKTIKPYPVKGDPKLRFNWNAPITTSYHADDRLYVGSQFVHRSDDQGESWRKVSPDLTTNDKKKQNQAESGGLSVDNSGAENHCTIFAIAESPLDENVIWVGTDDGKVQLTTNGGKKWNDLTANLTGVPSNTWCYHIEPSSFDKNTAYAVFDGHTRNDMTAYVLKTSDAGKTWTKISNDQIEGFARSIQEDYENPNLLFLGTEFGLYITLDGGKNWTKFEANMPAAAVHHVDLHKRDHTLVMATHGRGVIVIDDVRPLRSLTAEIAKEKVHFFDQGDQKISEGGGFGSSTYFEEFVGPSKSELASIKYYMKSRHVFGKMSLDILDKDGNVVASLPAGKAKGINEVRWNCRHKLPKVAVGKTISRGGFASPAVPAGEYQVRLKKGKKEYTSTLTLVSDPNSIHSDADRAVQYEKAMELYNANESLAYLVDNVSSAKEALEDVKPLGGKIAKNATKLYDDLNAMHEKLVVLTGDNYVGAAEPQLREKLGEVYSAIAGYAGRPTNAQVKNADFHLGELKKYESDFVKHLKSIDKLNEMLVKKEKEAITFRTKEEFLSADK